jgi:hypothetical protein
MLNIMTIEQTVEIPASRQWDGFHNLNKMP